MDLPGYYAAQLAGLMLGVAWFRWLAKDKWLEELCLVGIAGDALLTALIRYQDTGGNLAWWLLSMGIVAAAAPWLRRLQGKVGVMAHKRERRALAQLFGEPTLADMFFRDPRLQRFRAKRDDDDTRRNHARAHSAAVGARLHDVRRGAEDDRPAEQRVGHG